MSVNVKASPFSQVGLLAVDKSVLLLDEGNDFSVSQVGHTESIQLVRFPLLVTLA